MTKEKEASPEDLARGARLEALRLARGLSQNALAELAGFNDPETSGRQRVSRLESGYLKFTSPDQQAGYAKAFGVTVGAMLEYARGERTLGEIMAKEQGGPSRPRTDPTTARRAEDGRWRVYALSRLAFSAVANEALDAGVVTERMLDAASDRLRLELGEGVPSETQARKAIMTARENVDGWAKIKRPGTPISAQHGSGSKGKSTSR